MTLSTNQVLRNHLFTVVNRCVFWAVLFGSFIKKFINEKKCPRKIIFSCNLKLTFFLVRKIKPRFWLDLNIFQTHCLKVYFIMSANLKDIMALKKMFKVVSKISCLVIHFNLVCNVIQIWLYLRVLLSNWNL